MTPISHALRWGSTPWQIDFHPVTAPPPAQVDVAIIGGGFTGLSAAAALRRLDRKKTVVVFEAETIGARSSGHTGGLTLAETAAGDLPGLGDVLAGLANIVKDLDLHCDLSLPGALELDRDTKSETSPIRWSDSGQLRIAREVPGGTADPGKLVSGLARAAVRRGVQIYENARIENVDFGEPLTLHLAGSQVCARQVLFATNAESLEMNSLAGQAEPKLTLATATQPLSDVTLETLGLAAGKPFYTVDLPYLWGRLLHGNRIIWGSGLVAVRDWRDLATLDVNAGEAFDLLNSLEGRVRRLHPALGEVVFTNRWGGPILIGKQWRPVFIRHPKSPNAVVLGAYSGNGVALSVYLGAWAAESLLGRRDLPAWSAG
jgi:glycine/D-amino acid oxidase-like deaminating enzyme